VAPFLVLAGECQRLLGKGVRVLQMANPQMYLRQGEATEHLLAAHVLCHNLFQRLREQRHGLGDAPG
jgi:hypothetical protein